MTVGENLELGTYSLTGDPKEGAGQPPGNGLFSLPGSERKA